MSLKNTFLAALVLGIIVVGVFSPYLFFNKTFIPSDLQAWVLPWADSDAKITSHYLLDVVGEHYPWKHLLKESLQKGIFPLWNPYNTFGVPQVSISTPIYLDIFNSLYLISSSVVIDSLIAALKVFFAGLFLFLLLQYYRVSFAGSLLGAIAFMFSGSLTNMHTFYWTIGAFLWMPLVILFLEKSFEEKCKLKFLLCSGLVLGLAHLGGHLQSSMQILLLLFLWGCAKVIFGRKKLLSTFSYLGVAVIVSILVAAPAFFPVFELFAQGVSRSYSLSTWFGNFVNNLSKIPFIVSFFIPHFFGHHSIFSIVSITGEKWSNYLMGYVGFIPLVLAILAVRGVKKDTVKIYLALALLTIFVIFLTPLGVLFYLRALVIWCFAIAVLAGFGFDYCLQSKGSLILNRLAKVMFGLFSVLLVGLIAVQILISFFGQRLTPLAKGMIEGKIYPVLGFVKDFYISKIGATLEYYSITNPKLLITLLIIVCLGFIFMAYQRKPSRKFFASLLIAIVVVDLVYFLFQYLPVLDLEKHSLYPQTKSSRYLDKDKSIYRVMALSEEGVDPPIYHFESNIPHKIQAVHHCGSINYARPRAFRAEFKLASAQFNSAIANLSNVKYFLTKSIKLDDKKYPLVYSGEINIYKNPDYLPRVFTVTDFTIADSAQEVLRMMGADDFDPAREIVLEEEPQDTILGRRLNISEINIVKYDLQHIKIMSRTDEDSFLVVTDNNYPGWRAFIDGESTPVYTADYIFRAIYLPKGEHTVDFYFKPAAFKAGIWVSGATVIVLLFYIGYCSLIFREE